jgi:thioredoxin 1
MEALLSKEPVIVCKFTASWCNPCKIIQPAFESLAASYPKVAFVSIDADELDGIFLDLSVSILPTFIVFRQGEPIDRYSGSNEKSLKKLLKKNT